MKLTMGWMFLLPLGIGVLLESPCVEAAEPASKPAENVASKASFQVRGLSVTDSGSGMDRLCITSLDVRVTLSEGCIVGLNMGESRLRTMTDNLGKSFEISKVWYGLAQADLGHDNGSFGQFRLFAEGIPGPGADHVKATGDLVLRCSFAPIESFKQEKVSLKPGTKAKVGKIGFEIQPTKPERLVLRDGMQFSLAFTEDPAGIKAIRFLRLGGKEIRGHSFKALPTITNDEGEIKVLKYIKPFELEEEVESATVEVEYFTDIKTVKIPFSITTGLDLQTKQSAAQTKPEE